MGYGEVDVAESSERLKAAVQANHEEYRPATKARIDVDVHDAANAPVSSEVTLWAVDYGVLSLTGYKTPDVLREIYLRKALQVVNDDSREKIVSRRVLTPKGAAEGGGRGGVQPADIGDDRSVGGGVIEIAGQGPGLEGVAPDGITGQQHGRDHAVGFDRTFRALRIEDGVRIGAQSGIQLGIFK